MILIGGLMLKPTILIYSLCLTILSIIILSIKPPVNNIVYLFDTYIKVFSFEQISPTEVIIHYQFEGLIFLFIFYLLILLGLQILIKYFRRKTN